MGRFPSLEQHLVLTDQESKHTTQIVNLSSNTNYNSSKFNSCVFVTGYEKRAHFAQELIFQYKQLKLVTPLDFAHHSDSVKCYNFSQEDLFFML